MKYVSISPDDTLITLTEKVGINNIDQLLADNGLSRVPNIGQVWSQRVEAIQSNTSSVEVTQKISILNTMIPNSDVYEMAALSGPNAWKVIAETNTFPAYLYVSDQIEGELPESYNLIGNGISVSPEVYEAVNAQLLSDGSVDDSIFSAFGSVNVPRILATDTVRKAENPMSWFRIPQNEIILYSSITGEAMSIPAYPEDMSDARGASYITMPDLMYQYEPWQMYQGSGPKSGSYAFHLHRDMWTGDHTDGKANDLIRFCQAQVYAEYRGACVVSPTVALYIAGGCVINGVMTNVDVKWSGPRGLDDWYLEFTLTLDITEVSKEALSYSVVRSKALIA